MKDYQKIRKAKGDHNAPKFKKGDEVHIISEDRDRTIDCVYPMAGGWWYELVNSDTVYSENEISLK